MAKKTLTQMFGEWVYDARTKQGLTLEELAAKAKTSKSQVWSLENEGTRPRMDSAENVAAGLGVPLWKALQQAEAKYGNGSKGTKRT